MGYVPPPQIDPMDQWFHLCFDAVSGNGGALFDAIALAYGNYLIDGAIDRRDCFRIARSLHLPPPVVPNHIPL